MHTFLKDKTILLFDGECNLCDSSVQFILKHEKNDSMYFASLQSEIGERIVSHFDLKNIDSIVFIKNEKFYLKSTAGLKLVLYLKGLYSLLYGFIIVPPFIRNYIYNYIAKNRYKWFGKKESCFMPSPQLKKRFLS